MEVGVDGRMGFSVPAWEGWQESGRKLKMLKVFLIGS